MKVNLDVILIPYKNFSIKDCHQLRQCYVILEKCPITNLKTAQIRLEKCPVKDLKTPILKLKKITLSTANSGGKKKLKPTKKAPKMYEKVLLWEKLFRNQRGRNDISNLGFRELGEPVVHVHPLLFEYERPEFSLRFASLHGF